MLQAGCQYRSTLYYELPDQEHVDTLQDFDSFRLSIMSGRNGLTKQGYVGWNKW